MYYSREERFANVAFNLICEKNLRNISHVLIATCVVGGYRQMD